MQPDQIQIEPVGHTLTEPRNSISNFQSKSEKEQKTYRHFYNHLTTPDEYQPVLRPWTYV